METNIKILKTVVKRLKTGASTARHSEYAANTDSVTKQKNKLIQEVEYSIDMLETILEIEGGGVDEDEEGVSL